MTCKDCKYFDADNHPIIFSFMSRAGHCDKRVVGEYGEYPMLNCDACDEFEPKDDLLKMRSATKEERESVNKYIDSISESTGHNFYDSWESVSK